MVKPITTRNDILDDRYNAQVTTFHLTNGLVYSDTTTVVDVTGASVLSTTATPGAAANGSVGPTAALFTNSTGLTQNWDGRAIIVGGILEDGANDVNNSLADTLSLTYNWTATAT